MFKFLVFVVTLAFASATPTLNDGSARSPLMSFLSGRIINGTKTTIEANPHQVSLQFAGHSKDGHWCGGSIVSKYWVVTAGHCLMFEHLKLEVLAGTNNIQQGGSRHRIVRTILHPAFGTNDRDTIVNDIGLVRVAEPFEIDDTRRPIVLYEQNEIIKVGSMAVISGWGVTENDEISDILRSVEVPIISKERCNQLYENINGIAEGQICAAYENGGKDACQSDSGGPLTIDGRLAGIVSWGLECGVAGQPGVYTEVAHYHDWIERNAKS